MHSVHDKYLKSMKFLYVTGNQATVSPLLVHGIVLRRMGNVNKELKLTE